MQENFYLLATTLNSLVRKSVKERVSEMDIYILVNYETHQNSYIQYNKIIKDKAVSRRVLVSFVQKSVPRKLFSTFVTCIFYVKSK